MSTSFVDRFESHLDRFLPSKGQKCALFSCTPGKLWGVLALLSLAGSVSMGWHAFLATLAWEIVIGWGVSWLCRGCHYNWLWAMLVLFAALPAVIAFGAVLMMKDVSCPSCMGSA